MMTEELLVKTLLDARVRLTAGSQAVVRDAHLAEDVFQEVLLRALQSRDSFSDEGGLLAWARVTSRNLCFDQVRRAGRLGEILSELALDALDARLDKTADSQRQRAVAMRSCLEKLPEESRTLLRMRYDEGRKGEETGQHLARHGINSFSKPLTAGQWAQTYPMLLRQAGYRTAESFAKLPAAIRDSRNSVTPVTKFLNDDVAYQEELAQTYRYIGRADICVGRVMQALRDKGCDENTVMIFTSDNGSMAGALRLVGKWNMYLESLRVPLIIRDPRLPTSTRGRRTQMALNIDLAPTMLSLAGVPISGNTSTTRTRILCRRNSSIFAPTRWRSTISLANAPVRTCWQSSASAALKIVTR